VVTSEYGENGSDYPTQFTDVSYGLEGTVFSADIFYVDATSGPAGNTRLTQGGVFEPSGIDVSGNLGNDGAWEQRTFANAGTIFETGADTGSDDGLRLTTTVQGLDADKYEVFAYLWSDTNNNWDLAVGLAADSLQTFQPGSSGVVSLGGLDDGSGNAGSGFAEAVLVSEGNRTLYQVSVGEVTVDDSGSIDVYIDDVPNANGRSWYDGVGVRRVSKLVSADSSAHYLIPTNDDLGTNWTENDFDPEANGYVAGLAAIGYENNPASDTSFAEEYRTEIPNGFTSAYLRIPIQIDNVGAVSSMQLGVKYDDGFIAYLNGVEVASRFAPGNPNYDSPATGNRSDDESFVPEIFSLTNFRSQLVNGQNTLAFHGLNRQLNSSDFLLSPELLISTSTPTDEVRYFATPTPGAANGVGVLGFVGDVSVSVERGFHTKPFDVQLTSATPGAATYYTLDGSVPTPTNPAATLYSAPINIARTTNLRFAAHREGYEPSSTATHTYVFLEDVLTQDPRTDPDDSLNYPSRWQGNVVGDYEVDSRVVTQWGDDNPDNTDFGIREALTSIPTISLTLDHDELWNASTGIYPNAGIRGEAWRRAGSVEFIDPNSTAENPQFNVGIQMHGNASAFNERLLKHSFKLRFSPKYDGPGRLNIPLFDNTDFSDINQVVLRAAFTDAFGTRTVANRYSPLDSTYMRDVWMRDAQLAAGGNAAASTYVHLYVNGLYWGLYNPAERTTDEAYFASHLGGQEEDWDVIADFNELKAGNRNAWNEMFALSRSIRTANADEKYQEIQGKNSEGVDDPNLTNYLNIDRFVDYMVLHFHAGVEDWPHHNWHAAFNRVDPGAGFEFLTWDQEIGLDQLVRDRTEVSDANGPAELFDDLSRSAEFRLKVADRIQELYFDDGAFTVENNQQRWMDRANQIEKAIIGESARWGDAREGQSVTAYSSRSPLDENVTGAIPRGNQTVPLITVDHWRDSVTYVNETFFPGAIDIFLQRMRNDSMFPDVLAPSFTVNGEPVHVGVVDPSSELIMQGDGEVYYTLDGSDPRAVGGENRGTQFSIPLRVTETTTVRARTLSSGEWSPLVTATFMVDSTTLPGDFTSDTVVDARDIDLFFEVTNQADPPAEFDLNHDGDVSPLDENFLLQTILDTRHGDFDLNGKVEFADFLILSTNFGQQSSAGWSDGDANGDDAVTFADFLLLSANFGFDRGA